MQWSLRKKEQRMGRSESVTRALGMGTLAAVVVALACVSSPMPAMGDENTAGDAQVDEARASMLFQPVTDPRRADGPADAKIIRSRAVSVDLAQLTNLDPTGGQVARFNLFDDAAYDVVFERFEPISAETFGWIGRLTGDVSGTFALVVVDDLVAMNIHTLQDGSYQVRHIADDVYAVIQVDPAAFPPCANGGDHIVGEQTAHVRIIAGDSAPAQPPEAKPAATDEMSTSDDSPDDTQTLLSDQVIDVLVVYTSLARAAAGSTNAIKALINLGALEANDAYVNSGSHQSLNLVYVGEIAYTEPGSIETALDDLTNKHDGLLREVHDLRGIYGADMVSLIIENTSYCGLAWVLTEPALESWHNWTFSAVRYDCVAGPNWSFAHELGHNMACFHDRDNVSPEAPEPLNPWAYGFRFYGVSGTQWRTIMAYAPGNRIQYFSNPFVEYDGEFIGRPFGWEDPADNTRTLGRTASFMLGLREPVSSIAWVDLGSSGFEFGTFTFPYNTLTEGINAIAAGGTVAVKSSSSSASRLLTKRMIVRAYDGSVTLGH